MLLALLATGSRTRMESDERMLARWSIEQHQVHSNLSNVDHEDWRMATRWSFDQRKARSDLFKDPEWKTMWMDKRWSEDQRQKQSERMAANAKDPEWKAMWMDKRWSEEQRQKYKEMHIRSGKNSEGKSRLAVKAGSTITAKKKAALKGKNCKFARRFAMSNAESRSLAKELDPLLLAAVDEALKGVPDSNYTTKEMVVKGAILKTLKSFGKLKGATPIKQMEPPGQQRNKTCKKIVITCGEGGFFGRTPFKFLVYPKTEGDDNAAAERAKVEARLIIDLLVDKLTHRKADKSVKEENITKWKTNRKFIQGLVCDVVNRIG